MDKEQRIGITEISDPAFHLDIFDRLYKGNIIITKSLTPALIEKLVENKDKCILHVCVTGFGGSKIEPFVPPVAATYNRVVELINKGFPVDHIVLRIDPIVPTEKGHLTAIGVIMTFKGLGIKRVRISFLDMYKHVKERFNEKHIPMPDNYDINGFHANDSARLQSWSEINKLCSEYGMEVEMCGEPPIDGTDFKTIGCLSQKDIDILGLTDEIKLEGKKDGRKECQCPSNKYELIKDKPHQCSNACLYCFWKSDK